MDTAIKSYISAAELEVIMDHPVWDNHAMCWKPNTEDALVGLGSEEAVLLMGGHYRETIERMEKSGKYWMGYWSYDLKNEFEALNTARLHPMQFADACFFVPKVLLAKREDGWEIVYDRSDGALEKCRDKKVSRTTFAPGWKPAITREEYIRHINALLDHIRRGDIYEINYCQSFSSEWQPGKTWNVFQQLNEQTQAPYAAYLRIGKHHLLSASPELFLKKTGNFLVSSPIKGTVRRGKDETEDRMLREMLRTDVKEKAENVMIVDLVRNDFSRLAAKNSVKVEELFGIYSFRTVHHMISTVSCILRPEKTLYDILKATFPMGSMTGAPKISAMRFADQWEATGRGVYSGSIGCLFPNGDFEFNVVIRTLMFDEEAQRVMFHVGGAITALCDPQKEYEETLLKGKAMMNLNI